MWIRPHRKDPAQSVSQQEEQTAEVAVEKRPNVLLIVVDDMAFNDLGIFGGEINTPDIDKLARKGMAFTSFYTAPTCSPIDYAFPDRFKVPEDVMNTIKLEEWING